MIKKTYSTVLFDLDGCIIDSLPVWLKAFRETFDLLGISLSDDKIISQGFHRWDQKAQELGIKDVPAFAKTLYEHFHAKYTEINLHEGFIETIKPLTEKGVACAIVTSTYRKTAEEILAQKGISQYFPRIIAWEDTKLNKPDPDPILFAMEELNAIPQETVMIGDNEVDIIAGNSAGVTSIWYYPESHVRFYPDALFKRNNPTFTITHFRELIDLL